MSGREITDGPIIHVIDYCRLFLVEQKQVRALSVEIEEARRALERCEDDRKRLREKVSAFEAKMQELEVYAADDMTGLASTGLRNRQLEAYMEQFKRAVHGLPPESLLPEKRLIVLSLDLDQFSAVNDKYGQPFGDSILRFVGEVISGRIRKCDIASRKGQRFTVILVDCSKRGAIMKAREVVQRIAAQNFGEGTPAAIQVTATIGVADYDGKMTREELLRRAECAMKYGKDNGRYCTVVYKEGGKCEVADSFVRNGKPKE